jgi:hypothetical protein
MSARRCATYWVSLGGALLLLEFARWAGWAGSSPRRPAPEAATCRAIPLPRAIRSAAKAATRFDKPSLYFTPNRGQVDARVAYYVQGRAKTLYFTPQGITFALTGPGEGAPASESARPMAAVRPVSFGSGARPEGARQRWVLKLEFLGANPEVQPRGENRTAATANYFKGA